MCTKKETLIIKWWPNALTTVQRGAQMSHQPLAALKSVKEAIPSVFSYAACRVVGNPFTTCDLFPRKYGIPIMIPTISIFTNIRFRPCSQFHASLYKQDLSVLMSKHRIIFTHAELSMCDTNLIEMKSYDQVCEHVGLHVTTVPD